MPVGDVPLCIELTDTALNAPTEDARMGAWGGLYQHISDAVTARVQSEPQDDMIDVLLAAEIDGVKLGFDAVVSNAMLLVQAGLGNDRERNVVRSALPRAPIPRSAID